MLHKERYLRISDLMCKYKNRLSHCIMTILSIKYEFHDSLEILRYFSSFLVFNNENKDAELTAHLLCLFYLFSVLMKGITWSRDSHGLFDYESRHLTKKTLKASYEAMI